MTPLYTHRQHQAQEAYAREQAAKVERCVDAEVERRARRWDWLLPENPTPADLRRIRATHRDRVDAAAIRAERLIGSGEPRGVPDKLFGVGVWLASHGFTDTRCKGERWFNIDFNSYRSLADVAEDLASALGRLDAMEAEHARNRDIANAAIDRGITAARARREAERLANAAHPYSEAAA